jgi:hypothetical protein
MENILDLKDFPALVDDFAKWFGLTPDLCPSDDSSGLVFHDAGEL